MEQHEASHLPSFDLKTCHSMHFNPQPCQLAHTDMNYQHLLRCRPLITFQAQPSLHAHLLSSTSRRHLKHASYLRSDKQHNYFRRGSNDIVYPTNVAPQLHRHTSLESPRLSSSSQRTPERSRWTIPLFFFLGLLTFPGAYYYIRSSAWFLGLNPIDASDPNSLDAVVVAVNTTFSNPRQPGPATRSSEDWPDPTSEINRLLQSGNASKVTPEMMHAVVMRMQMVTAELEAREQAALLVRLGVNWIHAVFLYSLAHPSTYKAVRDDRSLARHRIRLGDGKAVDSVDVSCVRILNQEGQTVVLMLGTDADDKISNESVVSGSLDPSLLKGFSLLYGEIVKEQGEALPVVLIAYTPSYFACKLANDENVNSGWDLTAFAGSGMLEGFPLEHMRLIPEI